MIILCIFANTLDSGENIDEPDTTMQPMVPEGGECPGSKIDTIVRTKDGRTFLFQGKYSISMNRCLILLKQKVIV